MPHHHAWRLGVMLVLASLCVLGCDPALQGPPPAPTPDPKRPLYAYYRQGVDLLSEWDRADTPVAPLMAAYPPRNEGDVTQIRRELRRLDVLMPQIRAVQAPEGVSNETVAYWRRLADLKEQQLNLYKQFYGTDWRQNASGPREQSLWFQASQLDAELATPTAQWLAIAKKFLDENPQLAVPTATPVP